MILGGRGGGGRIENGLIFSAGMPFENFPGEGILRFIFSSRRATLKKMLATLLCPLGGKNIFAACSFTNF